MATKLLKMASKRKSKVSFNLPTFENTSLIFCYVIYIISAEVYLTICIANALTPIDV